MKCTGSMYAYYHQELRMVSRGLSFLLMRSV